MIYKRCVCVVAIMGCVIFGAGCKDSGMSKSIPARDAGECAAGTETARSEMSKTVSKSDPARTGALDSATERSWLNDCFGDSLVLSDGRKVPVSTLKGKTIGIYFSAHRCPPCRAFTPELVKMYKRLEKEGQSFDIVFVSGDESQEAMAAYMEEMKMPWKGLPFGSSRSEFLAQKYGVSIIPTLVIVDKDGKTVTTRGRVDVAVKGAAAFDSWQK